jgi:hypothetical protein
MILGEKNFFEDGDLTDVFADLDALNEELGDIEEDEEMIASQRRYDEIIKKHRGEGKGNQ